MKEIDLCCMAQTKLTVNQSNMLDEMARYNGTTRSYELRMVLELYGRNRLNLEADRRELVEADTAGMSLYELYKELYPVKDITCIPWYTGIQVIGCGFIGLLELEMLNASTTNLLFKYTDRFLPPIRKRYPEIVVILEHIVEKSNKHNHKLTEYVMR